MPPGFYCFSRQIQIAARMTCVCSRAITKDVILNAVLGLGIRNPL